jgi:hypothetical protein
VEKDAQIGADRAACQGTRRLATFRLTRQKPVYYTAYCPWVGPMALLPCQRVLWPLQRTGCPRTRGDGDEVSLRRTATGAPQRRKRLQNLI